MIPFLRPILTASLLSALVTLSWTSRASAQTRNIDQRIDRVDRTISRASRIDRTESTASRIDRLRADRVTVDRILDVQPIDPEPTRDRDIAPDIDDDEPVRDEIDETRFATNEKTENETPVINSVIIRDQQNFPAVRGQVLAVGLSVQEKDIIRKAGFHISKTRPFFGGETLTLIESEFIISPDQMIVALRPLASGAVFAPNHIYRPTGDKNPVRADPRDDSQKRPGRAVGILDVWLRDGGHVSRNFAPNPTRDESHGQAVLSRLLQFAPDDLSIFAAGVVSGQNRAYAEAASMIEALVWLKENDVELVNISLAGPPNAVLGRAVDRFQAGGARIVAAVGNSGPLSVDIYPAAYDKVIGVTAIDTQGSVYAMATRGDHVDLAALGVNVEINGQVRSGTSFAAPLVTAALAGGENLLLDVSDLGEPGRDDIFGRGAVYWASATAD